VSGMEPEEIPANRREAFPCPNCDDGNIIESDGVWQCDKCDWTPGVDA
jgi:ribosomal protein L37AE/L43A